jgi:hypothetical protein
MIIFKYIILGILSAYLLVYGLRPSIPYPESILDFYENIWLLLLLILFNVFVYYWYNKAGILLSLAIIALILDMIQFGH